MKEVGNYGKIVYVESIFENGWWEDAYFSSAPGQKLQKPSKESGIFQSLCSIDFVLFTKRQIQKGGGGHGPMPTPKYAPGFEG